jgi:ATP-binding cassette subfamily F protein uup
VRVGYYDQRSRALDTSITVRAALVGDKGEVDWRDRKLMERFWFDDDAQRAPISLLSGGERRRLQLLLTLLERPNVLLLDEPTNDLDLDTLRALEDFLDDWPGALVVASHDRAFLDRTVDHVLAIGSDARVERVPGGVAGWLATRSAGTARAGSGPTPRSSATERPRDRAPSASTVGRRLRETEQAMAKAERARDRLLDELGAATEHADLARLGVELAAAQVALDELEERWLELADGT